MQSFITLLLHFPAKAWAAPVVAALRGGGATVFSLSSANAAFPLANGHRPAWVQPGCQRHLNGTDVGRLPNSIPVMAEANTGLALIPLVAAMRFFSSRQVWAARRALAADGQNAGVTSKASPQRGDRKPRRLPGLNHATNAPAGDGRTFPARLNRRTQGNQNVQRSEPTITAAGRDGNHNQRAFSPPLCRRRYAHWRRQLAIYAAAARRQDTTRRGR